MKQSAFVSILAVSALAFLSGCRSGASQPSLHPSSPSQPRATTASASGGNVWRMKKAEAHTQIGWDPMPQWGIDGRPLQEVVAMSMMVPTDWNFQGGPYNQGPADCNFNSGRLGFVAVSPDKKMGIVSVPAKNSVWSSDPRVLQAIAANNQQFQKMQQCKVEQAGPLANKIVAMAKAMAGNNIQIMGPMEPIPGMAGKLPGIVDRANRNLAEQAAQNGVPASHVAVEAGRIPTRGKEPDGSESDGYFAVMQVTRTDTLANGATFVTTDFPMKVGMFAPVGKMAENERMFAAMLDSVWINPAYQQAATEMSANMLKIQQITKQRLNQIAANMAADNANAARQQQAIRMGVQNYANQVHSNVAANRSAALEHSSQQFSMYMGDQAMYHDPATGQNVQLSSQYGHVWASSTGNTNEYILTDSPSYNPNGQAGSGGWTQMEQVR